MVLNAVAAARRETSAPERGDQVEKDEVVEMVLVTSPWFKNELPVSTSNMRGYVGKVAEEKGDKCLVHLWRSGQNLGVDQRTYAPAWRRARDGKELFTTRKEKGFSEPVSILASRGELVADVRGWRVKGGVQLDRRSTAWKHMRGRDDGEAQGVVA